ncbi:MAG TPA: helix-turn-helix domain-containing protein [Thermoanaerobaculia bacterium]
MSNELGRAIRETRVRKGLSQARVAEMAGISRRRLAAIELGANTSTRVLGRLAEVLQLRDLPLGRSSARVPQDAGIGTRLLLDRASTAERAVREAAAAMYQVKSAIEPYTTAPVDTIRDTPAEDHGMVSVPLLAEINPGDSLAYARALEMVSVDSMRIETGEAVVRIKTRKPAREGIVSGDLLIVELRPNGTAATGELVIAIIEGQANIGRWWNKHGRRLLRGAKTNRIIREIGKNEAVVILGAVTDVIRESR